ncbi:GNAT family N-acetyltransferase [Capnocytophaga genosp. AHN8471]|uniref:GNAT family N-acetyltransferase n=2 Tax=Capnocytophaga TaxID=1016 RepID=A0A1Z4BR56_9FLAO|nr:MULTISPECIES: GNAT family N-acetyltransferase [Capnocytophaga]ASF43729.1 GNAT family N-acetyltransferase [Capnocytophaga endodontalis]MBM0651691.1 GNAT family N-acetyltransferase [Capnocytophaga genosp. AHN8471]MBM0663142.1 GNAT family N-acetyltransferase [Capnocytophaga genosp. AHN8471]
MIKLRALEPEDIDFLYLLENEESLWEVSETQLPFAKHLLQDYIQHAHQDIYEAKQYRYVISFEEGTPMGCVDLYDFSPKHRRAAVGIALLPVYRGKGYAKEALQQLIAHTQQYLDLHQLIAYIPADNEVSIRLFERVGFSYSGVQKDWLYSQGVYKDMLLYQNIFK